MIRRNAGDWHPANWAPDLKVPRHTLWLPLGSKRPLRQLGSEAALKVLGPDMPSDRLDQFARVIRDGTQSSRDRGAMMGGLIFFPDYKRLPPIATIDVFGYHPAVPGKPGSLEYFRKHFGVPDRDTVGPVEVTSLQLPAGPAIRFHRRRWPKQGWDPAAYQWEEVSYAVRPPEITSIVVVTVAWVEFKFSAELVNAADAIAPTLAIRLDDAELEARAAG
jgi:hypothetical protein